MKKINSQNAAVYKVQGIEDKMTSYITPLTIDDFLFEREQERKQANNKQSSEGGESSAGKNNYTDSCNSYVLPRLLL